MQEFRVAAGDVFVIAQKIVSKAEGRIVSLDSIDPSARAAKWAQEWGKDPRVIELVLRESKRIIRMERGVIVAETRHGFVCANAGIDLSPMRMKERRSSFRTIRMPPPARSKPNSANA